MECVLAYSLNTPAISYQSPDQKQPSAIPTSAPEQFLLWVTYITRYLTPHVLGQRTLATSMSLGGVLHSLDTIPIQPLDTQIFPQPSQIRFAYCPLSVQLCVENWLNSCLQYESYANKLWNATNRKWICLVIEQRLNPEILR